MWFRALTLLFAAGCLAGANASDEPTATAAASTTIRFQCLNHTSIHIVTCTGSISLFPITIRIDDLSILSDNDIHLLEDELNDLSIVDDDVHDAIEVLNDVGSRVIDVFLHEYGMILTEAAVLVCTADETGICT